MLSVSFFSLIPLPHVSSSTSLHFTAVLSDALFVAFIFSFSFHQCSMCFFSLLYGQTTDAEHWRVFITVELLYMWCSASPCYIKRWSEGFTGSQNKYWADNFLSELFRRKTFRVLTRSSTFSFFLKNNLIHKITFKKINQSATTLWPCLSNGTMVHQILFLILGNERTCHSNHSQLGLINCSNQLQYGLLFSL